MQTRPRASQLKKIPIFAKCSKRELDRLLDRTRSETVDAGHKLLLEGSPGTNLYLIVAGTATVRRNGRRIAQLGPGDVVGELAVILGEPRTATVVAETPIEWLVLDRASLRKAFDDVPGLGWNVLQAVAGRLSQTSQRQV